MAIFGAPVGRIREMSLQIKLLEDKLMSNQVIPMSEQSLIHAEIRKLRKELEALEKRTR
jgi:hypothetical protein